ncbi:MAG TPA: hypothetical protein VLA62_06155 [Solirubrobacterales bacterium]|nr:hypothetical protein [Solirubrobacterales bacterium]
MSTVPAQLKRMKVLGVVVTTVPGFLYLAGDRYGLDQLGERAVPLRALLDAEIPVALDTDGVPISMLWTVWEVGGAVAFERTAALAESPAPSAK